MLELGLQNQRQPLKHLVYYYSIYCIIYVLYQHQSASIVIYATLLGVPTIQCWLSLVLLQHDLQHWANKASIHPSITQIAIALPFSLPSALDFQIRFQSVWMYSVAVRFPQREWETNMVQREGESVFTLLFLWNIYLKSPSALHLLHVCMSSCTPNSIRFNLNVHVWVTDHKFWGPSMSVNLLYNKYVNVCYVYLYGFAVVT